jgi:hypothetical protein
MLWRSDVNDAKCMAYRLGVKRESHVILLVDHSYSLVTSCKYQVARVFEYRLWYDFSI